MRGVTLAATLLCVLSPCRAAVLYVNGAAPGPTHDGTSWATAFTTVQNAVKIANGDEVWVAKGTYMELVSIYRTMGLYGGFAGTETSRSERDPAANPTVLSGSGLQGAVITITATISNVVVDGFTIRDGKAVQGGGISSQGDFVTIAHNTITNNVATRTFYPPAYGGGIYSSGPGLLVEHNTITNNLSQSVYWWDYLPTDGHGGGVYSSGASAIIRYNVISGNRVKPDALYPNAYGGGIECSNATVTNNIVIGNEARADGTQSKPYPHGVGYARGGGIYCGAGCRVADNLVASNIASGGWWQEGAGIYSVSDATAPNTITGNTIVSNPLPGIGSKGAAGASLSGTGTFANNLIAFNTDGGLSAGTATVRNNLVFSNGVNYVGGTDLTGTDGNISADPLFLDAPGGNYRVAAGSPALDAGDDSVLVPGETDLDGTPRKLGAHVDIGAYELAALDTALITDVRTALRLAAGLITAPSQEITRLDIEASGASAGHVDLADAIRLIRRAWKLDP